MLWEVELSVKTIGNVKLPSGKSYRVKWDASSHHLYVGGYHAAKAPNLSEAMQKAEAFIFKRKGITIRK